MFAIMGSCVWLIRQNCLGFNLSENQSGGLDSSEQKDLQSDRAGFEADTRLWAILAMQGVAVRDERRAHSSIVRRLTSCG